MLKATDISAANSSNNTTPDKNGTFRSKLPRRSLGAADSLNSSFNGSNNSNVEHNYLLGSTSVFNDVWKLYLMHFFFVFISRMWDFGIVMLVAQLQVCTANIQIILYFLRICIFECTFM